MKNILLSFFLAVVPAAAASAMPQRIGAAGGVSGLVKATAPDASEARVIMSGAPLFLNDRVVTDGKGKLQVMLLDETVFTVGPNSDLKLDEFVYDPSTDAGKVSVKITKGVFRFVTGKVARKEPDNMKVKLSVGTIGIRGTMFYVGVTEPGGAAPDVPAPGAPGGSGQGAQPPMDTTVILLGPGAGNNANEAAGAITVNNGGGAVFIDQPGFGVTFTGPQPMQVLDMSQQVGQLTSGLSAAPAQGGAGGGGSSQAPSGTPGGAAAGGGALLGAAGGSAGEAAGQLTAAAGTLLADASSLGGLTQPLAAASNQAGQDTIVAAIEDELPPVVPPVVDVTIPDGVSTWDDVRSVIAGTAYYSGTGMSYISGSAYDNTPFATNVSLLVDFGSRKYGDGNGLSAISIPSFEAKANILETSFASLTGNAAITLSTDNQNIDNSAFDNSTLTFNNLGGIPATSVTVGVNYNGGLYTGTGQVPAVPSIPPLP